MSNKVSVWIKLKNNIFYLGTVFIAFFVIIYVFFRELLLRNWSEPWNSEIIKEKETETIYRDWGEAFSDSATKEKEESNK